MLIEDRGPGFQGKASLHGWMIWGTAALFYLYEFFVRVAPSAMEPELQSHFGLSAAALGAAAGTYYLVYSPMQLISGTIIDRFGVKQVLVVSALICTSGAFLEIIGSSSFFLVAARFAQGFGSAFAFVGTMYIAAEWFPRSMLARLSGLTTSLGMAGAIIGNAGIARMVETLGWQSALVGAGFVGIGITALIVFVIPSRPPAGTDVPHPYKPNVLRALRIVYANPQSWYLGIIGAALYMPLSILGALWGAEYISAVTGASKLEATGAVSMMYVGWLVGGPLAGFASDKLGIRRPILLYASAATVVVTFVIAVIPGMSLPVAYLLLLLLGLASCSQVICFATVVEHNPHTVTGTALASTNMIIMLAGGIAEWAFGLVLDLVGGSGDTGQYSAQAYHYAILMLPAISLVGLAAATMVKEAKETVGVQEAAAPA